MTARCLVCGTARLRTVGAGFTRCGACGFVEGPMLERTEASGYVEFHDTGRGLEVEEARRPVYASVLARFAPHGACRCLDVGSGSGVFPRMAARAGWACVGVDPAGPAQADAGVELLRAEFPPAPPGAFELITFFGSLNYMRDPVAALAAARAALAPAGRVVIRVPNVDVHLTVRRAARVVGRDSALGRWLTRGTIVHPRAFSARALRRALARAGFRAATVEGSRPAPGDPYGSDVPALGVVKVVAGAVTLAIGRLSGGHLLLAPSLLAIAQAGAPGPAARIGGMPSPSVLHVITRLTLGGASETTVAGIEAAAAAGYRCTLAVGIAESEAAVVEAARRRGVEVLDVPTLGREASPRRDLRAVADLVRITRRVRPSIVHTHTSKAGFVGRLAARLARVPVIVHQPHGHIFYGYYGRRRTALYIALERLAARWADRIIVLTERGITEHLAHGIGRAGQFVVIPSGVPVERLRAEAPPRLVARAALGLPHDAFVIVALGRLVPIKGFDLLVEALPAVSAALPATRLLIVGDGPLRGALARRAEALGLSARLAFTGARADVAALLAAGDVLAAPSRNEGMGRAIVEAMAVGLPIVAAAVGGIPSVVTDGECGRLVDPENAAALAGALIELGLDDHLRQQQGKAALRRADAFSNEVAAARLLALYGALVSHPSAA